MAPLAEQDAGLPDEGGWLLENRNESTGGQLRSPQSSVRAHLHLPGLCVPRASWVSAQPLVGADTGQGPDPGRLRAQAVYHPCWDARPDGRAGHAMTGRPRGQPDAEVVPVLVSRPGQEIDEG